MGQQEERKGARGEVIAMVRREKDRWGRRDSKDALTPPLSISKMEIYYCVRTGAGSGVEGKHASQMTVGFAA